MSRCRRLVFAGLVVVGLCSCRREPPVSAPAEKPKNEADLAFVTITPQAYKSLGIHAQPIKTGPVQEHLPLTGWIMAKQGHEVTLTAPVSGYVRLAVKAKRSPQAGEAVTTGQELLSLDPVLSPVEHIQMAALQRSVDSELTKAKETLEAAKKELDRVKVLFDQKLRGDQELEQAQVKFRHADEDLKAATDKLKLFETPQRTIVSPRAGTVVTVQVSPGQYVAAAAPLLTLIDLGQVWVRVPVPEFDLPQVNAGHPVTLTLKNNGVDPGANPWASHFNATAVALVPQVDPLRHTADLIYDVNPYSLEAQRRQAVSLAATVNSPLAALAGLPAHRAAFAKDQMVTVFVALGRKRTESVVPYSAIVFDAFEGTWIYLDRSASNGPPRFERRRIELGPRLAEGVIIRPTASANERVVVAGAAALYSREFHSPPVAGGHKQKVDDDD